MHPWVKKIVYSEEEINKKIIELAKWVDETYKDSKDLVLICLLKGAVPFLAALSKRIHVDHVLDFMIISTYSGNHVSSGSVKIVMDLALDIKNKDVLIVEDVIESGITLDKTKSLLLTRQPRSLKILTLLDKPHNRKVNLHADKFGFEAPNEFLVGFGLDYDEKLRNLPYIGIFNKKFLKK
ncbi:hypoxanthine phosphoribosyltransferase [Metamycoplasma subdolum]|uniref:Hypoxanthine phosphoribosyltransferase n=1 Tax=Metamycoplasma subdolum TaxID=92407 RepID=A0A3L9ZXI3_9BACT|nr:hypoxanthine phosphoribosyltransferase [Metamycoplasma subdolum]RMA77423.1 hypoxanthine phosphoribosyltransferase [Metamycoplasma subdolum]WPB50400.1 hypoxanthine phosphoribosyltransferase [Metamycoplasma subdolum]